MSFPRNPIAIVGIACRFPGGIDSMEAYWEVLRSGKDVVTEIDDERWGKEFYFHPGKQTPGKSYTWAAGVLPRVDMFDAGFFGISPREARQMDPQHRLLLELAWEALEDGNQIPATLAGTKCGVYVGISGTDYKDRRIDDPSSGDAYLMTGNTLSVAANRISYVLDLRGPSMAVDTACSSSLVALNEACIALWSGEVPMALIGGINLLLSPLPFIGFSQATMLSPHGRCRFLDARCDGYVRAEGGALIFLKPLEHAERDGDQVHAVILATGANCDGQSAASLTIPSVIGQESLLQDIYLRAGIDFDALTYVEAHGTGTPVGDPAECTAIGNVIGRNRRPFNPILIGSAKSNLGHLEPASGMAGLLKVVLAIKHRAIPPSLHLKTPNPAIDFTGLNLRPVTELTSVGSNGERLYMGVNSFGFGGANAHVLVAEHRSEVLKPKHTPALQQPYFLMLSARSDGALDRFCHAYEERLEVHGNDCYPLLYTSALRRQHHDYRLVVTGRTLMELKQRLRLQFDGRPVPGVVRGRTLAHGKLQAAFVFSGNGSQWPGMGHHLMNQEPLFHLAVEEVDSLFRECGGGFSLVEELEVATARNRLGLTEIAQPTLFAIQVGLVRLLNARGVQAQAAVGHSVGEVAAAWMCGALTLKQAVTVIHERSRAQAQTRGSGRMAALGLSPDRTKAFLAQLGVRLEIAGYNAPGSVTLSGPLEDLKRMEAVAVEAGAFYKLLDLDYAFHSSSMNPIKDLLMERLNGLSPGAGELRFFSTVTGEELDGRELGAAYWWHNIRQPVRFDKAIGALIDAGTNLFIEIGPHAVLGGYINESLARKTRPGRYIATLRRDAQDEATLVDEAVAAVYVAGNALDLKRLFPVLVPPVSLPSYPWQRERHWYEQTGESMDMMQRHYVHPLLGYRVKAADAMWENQIDPAKLPYLADHVVGGAIVFPAAAFVEIALAASREWYGGQTSGLEDLEIRAPLVLEKGDAKVLRFVLSPDDGRFIIKSRLRLSAGPWVEHGTGRLLSDAPLSNVKSLDLEQERRLCPSRLDACTHYRNSEERGLHYGSTFRLVEEAFIGEDRILAKIKGAGVHDKGMADYLLYPPVLDNAFQLLLDLPTRSAFGVTRVPYRMGRMHWLGGEKVTFARLIRKREHRFSAVVDVLLADANGRPLAVLEECRARDIPGTGLAQKSGLFEYQVKLQPLANLSANTPFLDLQSVTETALGRFRGKMPPKDRDHYFTRTKIALDGLVSAFALETLLPMLSEGGGSVDEIIVRSGLVPTQRPYLLWLLQILEGEGQVTQQFGTWHLHSTPPEPLNPTALFRKLIHDHPACLAELLMVGRRGRHLNSVLVNPTGPMAELFPATGSSTQELLYGSSPSFRPGNLLVEELFRALTDAWPTDHRLRILLLDAGYSGLHRSLLTLCPPASTDLHIAILDKDSVGQIAGEYADMDWVDVTHWNSGNTKGQEWLTQPEVFDLVIAPHVLSTFSDRDQVLDVLQQRLAGNGLLILLEHAPDRVLDFSFGADPDWWMRVMDGTRHLSPLKAASEWRDWLLARNMKEVSVVSDRDTGTEDIFVVLARKAMALVENPVSFPPFNENIAARVWLLLCEAGAESSILAEALSRRLRHAGAKVLMAVQGSQVEQLSRDVFRLDIERLDDVVGLLNALEKDGVSSLGVVHLLGWQRCPEDEIADLLALEDRRCLSTVVLTRAARKTLLAGPIDLWLITGAGVPLPPSGKGNTWSYSPSQSPLWGLGRVLMNEHPDLNCRLVDLQGEDELARMADWLFAELIMAGTENEVIWSPRGRHVLRMRSLANPNKRPDFSPGEIAARGIRLRFSSPGLLRNLRWETFAPPLPGKGEVLIAVRATGLNFRDVMYTIGLLPDEALENGFAGPTLGLEVAGDVVKVGPDVTNLQVGDAVFCYAADGFGSHVTSRADTVMLKPATWTYEEAATTTTAFFTVHYALVQLARLQPTERILIHGAAGGVGIAAIQYALHLGAEIFATAGTEEKRDFVRLLGADHVLDSRSVSFAADVMALTGGEGVDVVLNSLSGESMRRGLNVLRPFGRFLELGKRDFYENSRIGLRPFRNNFSYFGIDADQVMLVRPDLARHIFCEMLKLFNDGVLSPLPHRAFPARQVVHAFQAMQHSRHIGKLVLSMDERDVLLTESVREPQPLRLNANGTYLVTGGLSGFGLATAQWLVDKGARHLSLIGRRGTATPGGSDAVTSLIEAGAAVRVFEADVTDANQLGTILRELEYSSIPLRGVVHAAMMLDDGLLGNLDRNRMRRVLAPKMLGAWNLHRLTQHLSLDFFVVYSSATTFIGNPGQGNYVAANTYVESLIHYRRMHGLPGLFVAWGPISDVGHLARNQAIRDSLQRRLGGAALNSKHALSIMEELLVSGSAGYAVIDLDWKTLKRSMPGMQAPKYSDLDNNGSEMSLGECSEDIRIALAGHSLSEARKFINAQLVAELAGILRLSPEKIESDSTLGELGMDSLMGVELGLAVERRLGVKLPMMFMSEGLTISNIIDRILSILIAEGDVGHSQEIVTESPELNTSESLNENQRVEAFLQLQDRLFI